MFASARQGDGGELTELPQGTQDTSLPLLLSEPPSSALWTSGTPMVGWTEWLKGVFIAHSSPTSYKAGF